MFKKKIDIDKERQESYNEGVQFGYKQGIEANKDMIEKRALDLYTNQNWLVNPNQVFQVSKTNIAYLGQEPITKNKAQVLQEQAKALLNFELWSILTTLIRQKAIDKAVLQSTEYNHVLPGKMMVHNIALMESLVKYIAEIDINKIVDGRPDKIVK